MEQKLMEHKYSGEVIEGGSPASTPEPTTEKGRRFIFTYYPKADENLWDASDMSYMYYGEETCPTTGRRHHQGWFITHNSRSERALCKRYGCYVRIQRGTYTHNWKYCSKEGKVHEFGRKPTQGKRTDLEGLRDLIVEQKETTDSIAISNPMIFHQYGRTLERIEDITMRKQFRTEKTSCIWYVSPTGLGKSHIAFQNFHPDTHYNWVDDKGWWDNYRQQETVIIDEFRGQIPYNELLRLTDKWPYDVRRRGRQPMPFTSKKIIITSSMTPQEVYHNLNSKDSLDQLMRRITVKHIWKNGVINDNFE